LRGVTTFWLVAMEVAHDDEDEASDSEYEEEEGDDDE
jgi:hypothetical protein